VLPTFINRDGEQFGPFSPKQVQQMQQAGQVLPSDFYWQEGMQVWGVVSDQWHMPPTPIQIEAPTPPCATANPPRASRAGLTNQAKPRRQKTYRPVAICSLIAFVVLLASAAAFLMFQSTRTLEGQEVSKATDFQEPVDAARPPITKSTRQTQAPSLAPTQGSAPIPLPLPPSPAGHLRVVVWNIE
jgi:hypothetical protein